MRGARLVHAALALPVSRDGQQWTHTPHRAISTSVSTMYNVYAPIACCPHDFTPQPRPQTQGQPTVRAQGPQSRRARGARLWIQVNCTVWQPFHTSCVCFKPDVTCEDVAVVGYRPHVVQTNKQTIEPLGFKRVQAVSSAVMLRRSWKAELHSRLTVGARKREGCLPTSRGGAVCKRHCGAAARRRACTPCYWV